MKHAYLIIAHNNFGHLKRLVDTLCKDKQNDIYVHLDAKAGTPPEWLININCGGG